MNLIIFMKFPSFPLFYSSILDHIPSQEEQATGIEKLEYDALMAGVQVLLLLLFVLCFDTYCYCCVCRIPGIWKYRKRESLLKKVQTL